MSLSFDFLVDMPDAEQALYDDLRSLFQMTREGDGPNGRYTDYDWGGNSVIYDVGDLLDSLRDKDERTTVWEQAPDTQVATWIDALEKLKSKKCFLIWVSW